MRIIVVCLVALLCGACTVDAQYTGPQQVNETRIIRDAKGLVLRDAFGNCVALGLTRGKHQNLTYTLLPDSECEGKQ